MPHLSPLLWSLKPLFLLMVLFSFMAVIWWMMSLKLILSSKSKMSNTMFMNWVWSDN